MAVIDRTDPRVVKILGEMNKKNTEGRKKIEERAGWERRIQGLGVDDLNTLREKEAELRIAISKGSASAFNQLEEILKRIDVAIEDNKVREEGFARWEILTRQIAVLEEEAEKLREQLSKIRNGIQ